MTNIGLVKETFGIEHGTPEKRVALTPKEVEKLTIVGYTVTVQKDSGKLSCYSDEDYKNSGAEIVETFEKVVLKSDIITKVKQLTIEEIHQLQNIDTKNKTRYIMSFFDANLITTENHQILMDNNFRIVRTSQASLDAMSVISGKEMVKRILEKYNQIYKKNPEKVSIIGAGNAGMSAIIEILKESIFCEIFVRNIQNVQKELLKNAIDLNKLSINHLDDLKQNLDKIDCLISAIMKRNGEGNHLFSLSNLKKGTLVIDLNPYSDDTFIKGIKPTISGEFEIDENGVYFFSIHNYPSYANNASEKFSEANFPHLIQVAEKIRNSQVSDIEIVNL